MFVCFVFFFFQAEDGIRDLVRSRGLGDVYKRQPLITRYSSLLEPDQHHRTPAGGLAGVQVRFDDHVHGAVHNEVPVRVVVLVAVGVEHIAVAVQHGEDEAVSYTHLTLPTGDLG